MDKNILDKLKTLTLLYAEDEEGIRRNIADSLRYYFKDVFEASNGEEAYLIYKDKAPNIILSDINMPILNGIEFIKKVRKKDRLTPVVMITAHTDKEYLLEAVELHMEKYLVKPIELDNLFEVLIQCVNMLDINRVVKLKIDNNYSYDFDKKEMLFFEILLKNQNRVTTYEELQEEVWGDDVMTDSALRSLVRNLRKKLPTDIIINLSGLGYRFV